MYRPIAALAVAAVVWNGPVDFSAGQPRIAVAPAGPLSGVPTAGLVALFAVLVVAGTTAYRRRNAGDDGGEGVVATDTAVGSETAGSETAASDGTAASGKSGLGGDGDADTSGESDDEADAAPTVDSDLLSNEEQVLRLIESQGGRMKQKQVAEELDWTAAKTSQVVTGLRDEGDLDGFRLGRENVLSLPEFEPDGDASDEDAESEVGDDAGGSDADGGDGNDAAGSD